MVDLETNEKAHTTYKKYQNKGKKKQEATKKQLSFLGSHKRHILRINENENKVIHFFRFKLLLYKIRANHK